MLSFVLPLTALAIVLTPVVASAGAIYKREIDAHDRRFSDAENDVIGSIELNR